MIDIETERIIPIKDVPNHCPGCPHMATVYRWAGRRQEPLETIKVGGRRYASIEAIERFIRRCTEGPGSTVEAPLSAKRRREIEAAERELEEVGIR